MSERSAEPATERPWLILTLRRTGGTSLTAFLSRASSFPTLEHEPFNPDRSLGHITRAFVGGGTREDLRENIAQALTDRPNIKHCIDVVGFKITQDLIDACVARDYAIFVLIRRDEARRLGSLVLAQATGAWGPIEARQLYPKIRTGDLRPNPIDLDKLRLRVERDRQVAIRLSGYLKARAISFRQIVFEDLYYSSVPLAEQARDIARLLGIALAPDAPDLLYLTKGEAQRSEDIAPYVPGYPEAVTLAQTLCQNPPTPHRKRSSAQDNTRSIPRIHPAGGYVFIITYGRSGSTLLQNLLNNIPGYQIRGENNNALPPLVQSWNAIRQSEPMSGLRKAGATTSQNHPFFGAENVDPKQYGKALAACFTQNVLRPEPGTRVSGFKEIRFHMRPKLFAPTLRFLRMFFPRCRFVFNTRNHDAVSNSGWWATMDKAAVLAELAEAEALFSRYIARNPDHCCHVHYDTYVKDPTTLKPLFDFLGEPMDPDIVARVFDRRLDHARGTSKKS